VPALCTECHSCLACFSLHCLWLQLLDFLDKEQQLLESNPCCDFNSNLTGASAAASSITQLSALCSSLTAAVPAAAAVAKLDSTYGNASAATAAVGSPGSPGTAMPKSNSCSHSPSGAPAAVAQLESMGHSIVQGQQDESTVLQAYQGWMDQAKRPLLQEQNSLQVSYGSHPQWTWRSWLPNRWCSCESCLLHFNIAHCSSMAMILFEQQKQAA
jgi:hypothetical protein